nr:hypothetical protein Iba_chr04cCG12040 [Ipomoea batatas]
MKWIEGNLKAKGAKHGFPEWNAAFSVILLVASNIPECATTDHIASDDKFSPLATMHIHNSTAFSELAQPYYGLCDDHEFINLLIGGE